ncbi:MAG: amidohydrolase family protein [Candidatus Melainabacteria bacterium]|nr:amidohydrolase family protein [Candidatus Melainabacteria bacterium]
MTQSSRQPSSATTPWYIVADWVLPVLGPALPNGGLQVDGSRIGAVFNQPPHLNPARETSHCLRAMQDPEQVWLLTPGLINTHAHLELFDPSPVAAGPEQPMSQWLTGAIERIQSWEQTEQATLSRCHNSLLELIQSGVTTVYDISRNGDSLTALAALGMRGVVALEYFHPGPLTKENPATATNPLKRFSERYQHLHQTLKPHNGTGIALHSLAISPHSLYNVSPSAWKWVNHECQPLRIHTHLAESQDELDFLGLGQAHHPASIHKLSHIHLKVLGKSFPVAWQGNSPVACLEQAGLLDDRLTVAHALFTSPLDRQILADHGVRVAHCPLSNRWIHGHTLRWQDWQSTAHSNDSPVLALGTDSRLSNLQLDLRAEARAACQLHGWSEATALRYASLEGARLLGWETHLGGLATGYQADMVLWQCPRNIADSLATPEAIWLHPATSVQRAWVNGACVYQGEV